MRLLNTTTLRLEEFSGRSIPSYAILSHTWGDDEVSFKQWKNPDALRETTGYKKIVSASRRARIDNLQYLWVDTICIDKRHSAELSEAINSMFQWYWNSNICYAYLADVLPTASDSLGLESLRKSRWFTRGWTLQETLAPPSLIFYFADWTKLGSKRASKISKTVAEVTGIHVGAILDRWTITDYSIAQRMSWASRRVTTRIEDTAYCLLGIFNINMPMLYGEGSRAFERLQEEIIKTSDDQSLFAWSILPGSLSQPPPRDDGIRRKAKYASMGVLAENPSAFYAARSIRGLSIGDTTHYSMTNAGLHITLPFLETCSSDTVFVKLAAYDEGTLEKRVFIPLRRVNGRWFRASLPTSPLALTHIHTGNPTGTWHSRSFYIAKDGPAVATDRASLVWIDDSCILVTLTHSNAKATEGNRYTLDKSKTLLHVPGGIVTHKIAPGFGEDNSPGAILQITAVAGQYFGVFVLRLGSSAAEKRPEKWTCRVVKYDQWRYADVVRDCARFRDEVFEEGRRDAALWQDTHYFSSSLRRETARIKLLDPKRISYDFGEQIWSLHIDISGVRM